MPTHFPVILLLWKLTPGQDSARSWFQNPGWLGYIRDEKLPSYIGTIISHYKDPYQPTSIMECQQGFERCSLSNKNLIPRRLILRHRRFVELLEISAWHGWLFMETGNVLVSPSEMEGMLVKAIKGVKKGCILLFLQIKKLGLSDIIWSPYVLWKINPTVT